MKKVYSNEQLKNLLKSLRESLGEVSFQDMSKTIGAGCEDFSKITCFLHYPPDYLSLFSAGDPVIDDPPFA